jgi:HD superfamily phosphodiesterase
MKGYQKVREKALAILKNQLPENLYYHSINHTLEVLAVCNEYIERRHIDDREAWLLRLGALLHDIGFTVSNVNHEESGCLIAEKLLTEYDFSQDDIEVVKGLIRATKIPQTPTSTLEEIICDSDLDYLGRENFYQISNLLFKELQAMGVLNDQHEWNLAQIKFLEAHTYHTDFAKKYRQPVKEKRIIELKKMVEEQA